MSNLLSQASLVMIPSGYKEDVVYSQIPTNGSGDLSFTRASNGTRINSAGLVEVCPWNLASYSEEFDNAAWVKTTDGQVTITANATTAPNGTTTAEKMIASAIAGFHCVAQTQSLVAGVFTISIYAKASEYSFLQIFDSLTTDFANFNLTTGAVATVDTYTATIENVGNGWYRCTATKTNPSGNFVFRYGIVTTGTATRGESFTGNGVNGLFIWGAQLNIGSTAKPYFPTTDRLNVPRLTYQNGGGGCPSLLLEKQSTNVLTYSEQFDNADWNKIQISATANNTTSPDGTQNADLITTTATGVCYTYELIAGTNGAYSASVYAKKGNNNYLALNIQNSVNNWVTSVFDLSDGSLGEYAQGSGGGIVYVNHTITPVGNGWYRCVLNYTTNQNSYYCPMFAPLKTGNSFTSAYGEVQSNANNKTIYLWGAQLEASSYPTSYIPTTSSSATRVADECFKTGISSLIGQTEGVIFVDFDFNGNYSSGGIIPISLNGISGDAAYIWVQTSGLLLCEMANSGSVQASIAGAIGSLGRKKIALAYKQNDFVVYLNGTQVGTDSSGTVPALSTLTVGRYYLNHSYDLNAGVNQAILFPTRLTNAELASLTTL